MRMSQSINLCTHCYLESLRPPRLVATRDASDPLKRRSHEHDFDLTAVAQGD
jgi:hypothetical protein